MLRKTGRCLTRFPPLQVDPDGPRIVITGPTHESIETAREMLEFVTQRVPVQQEQIGWLIGRGGKNFKELQEKTKVRRDGSGLPLEPSSYIPPTDRPTRTDRPTDSDRPTNRCNRTAGRGLAGRPDPALIC